MWKPLQHTRQFALTGIALIFMSSPTAAQDSFYCSSLWPSDELSGYLRDMPCEQYIVRDEAYLALEGLHYVYFPPGWLDSAEKFALVTRTIRAISFSLPYLNTLARENGFRPVTRTNSILGVEDYIEGWDQAAVVQKVLDIVYTDACPILINSESAMGRSRAQYQQTIAHELFHCLQYANGNYAAAQNLWWLEGSAAYYSNVIYCLANSEYRYSQRYNNLLPPTEHLSRTLKYATVIFFQYLGNSGGPDWLLRQLFHLPHESGFNRFAEELARWPGMAELFHGFAQSFTDDRIYDTDACLTPEARARTVMPRNPRFEPDPVAIEVLGNQPESVEIELPPFTLDPKRLILGAGKEFEIHVTASHPSGILSVRRTETGSLWHAIPSRLLTPCTGRDPEYLLLATSTASGGPADADRFRLTLDITPRDRDDCVLELLATVPVDCPAATGNARLDECLLGSWIMTEESMVRSLFGNWPPPNNEFSHVAYSGSIQLAFDGSGTFLKRFDATINHTKYDGTTMHKAIAQTTTDYRGSVGGCVVSRRPLVGPSYLGLMTDLVDSVIKHEHGYRDLYGHNVDRVDEGTPWNQWPRLRSGMGRYSCSADTLTIGSNRVYQRVR